jgi:hypothetical protein
MEGDRRHMRWVLTVVVPASVLAGCSGSKPSSQGTLPQGESLTRKTPGIRPDGDTTLRIATSMVPDGLRAVYGYIDEHIDEHVQNLQNWIRQPSISNSGEGIPETADMVKGFFDQLGCQQTHV